MNLPAIDVVRMTSASHHSIEQSVYPVQIELAGFPVGIQAPRAVGAALASQGLLLLIGRDVLQHATLVYNGPAGEITFCV